MKKLKVIGLGLFIGALLGTSLVGYQASVSVKVDRTLELREEVEPGIMAELTGLLPKDNEKTLLTIDSPGGDVASGKAFEAELRYRNVDTYVPVFAASMGAQIWMEGKRRFVEPDAIVLFHSVANGLGRPDQVGDMIKLLDSAPVVEFMKGALTVDEAVLLEPDVMQRGPLFRILSMLADMGSVDHVRDMLETTKNLMDNMNLGGLIVFDKLLSAKLTKERLLEIYGNFKKNKFILGKELYELGIATDLGHPDMADYGEE